MSKISAKAKQAIIEKILARDGRTISEIAEAHNSGYSTLQTWLKKSRNNAIVAPVKPRTNSQTLSLSERLQHLMATAALDETALGVYCREHGLYAIQLTQWKDAFLTTESRTKKQENRSTLIALRLDNKQLKKEVKRKNIALAEAAALLIF